MNQKILNIIFLAAIVLLFAIIGFYFMFTRTQVQTNLPGGTISGSSATGQLPNGTTSPTLKSNVYENQYMKITVPAGWTLTEATETLQDNRYDKTTGKVIPIGGPVVRKTGAANIVKDNYILYINPNAESAAGIEGGRFGDLAAGAPSAETVIDMTTMGTCASPEPHSYGQYSRYDYYVNKEIMKTSDECRSSPSDGSTAWYFSYMSVLPGYYFNSYASGVPNSSGAYVITMAYNSRDVNKLPKKGSTELNSMLSQMTDIVKTLELKQQKN